MKLRQLVLLAAFALPACGRVPSAPPRDVAAGNAPQAAAPQQAPQQAPRQSSQPGAAMKEQTVGEPRAFDNLAVFPIYAKAQVDVGPMTTLDAAIAKGKAEVREVGSDGAGGPSARASRHGYSGAQVNTLVIENKGDVPIYVLAGTVVKGGNQDRQIGQDFIIESKQTVPVDAFCVEHGRWTGERDGRATGGKFGATQQLVTSSVRAAAQYKKSQGEVWDDVEKVNKAHHKDAQSGTLFATLDAPDVANKRSALAEKVNAYLGGAAGAPNDKLVGFAYAIDGQVKGARWFASHAVFELFRAQLVNGAAVDALTAQAARGGAPAPKAAPLEAKNVVSFVDDVERAQIQEQRDTAAANANEYKESSKAYGSKTMKKPAAATPAAPKVQISSDYLAK